MLDLFAGSGALAIEALSRGAAEATLVDSSAAAVAAIRRNLAALGADAEVRRQRAAAFLEQARSDASSIRSGVPRSPIPASERPRPAALDGACSRCSRPERGS